MLFRNISMLQWKIWLCTFTWKSSYYWFYNLIHCLQNTRSQSLSNLYKLWFPKHGCWSWRFSWLNPRTIWIFYCNDLLVNYKVFLFTFERKIERKNHWLNREHWKCNKNSFYVDLGSYLLRTDFKTGSPWFSFRKYFDSKENIPVTFCSGCWFIRIIWWGCFILGSCFTVRDY